jgi:predicted AAA+ superfamily ATPase
MFVRDLHIPLESEKSFFLFGPRGTGKSTWLGKHLPKARTFNLLNSETYASLAGNPHRLAHQIPPEFSDWIAIDEVQRIPELLNEAHDLIESKGYKFALTGSSARSLRKKGTNLLAGRAASYTMHPLTATELGSDFDIMRSLMFGNLPGVYSDPDSKKFLKDYVSTYLREEVNQEGLTRNLGAFFSLP